MGSTLYARKGDYGTVGLYNFLETVYHSFYTGSVNATAGQIFQCKVQMYTDSLGLGVIYLGTNYTNGFQTTVSDSRLTKKMFQGIYPANLRSHSSFAAQIDNMDYYTFQYFDNDSQAVTQEYTVRLICDDIKGYEGIRLGWLNQYGAYDYYTFNHKSTKTISAQSQTYSQHQGSWNGSSYEMSSGNGGIRTYSVNAKESIVINTGYITEEEGKLFEEMIMSPEIHLIESFDVSDTLGTVNKYVKPVILTEQSIQRKTKANDRLIQHTFNIEYSNSTNTQNI